MSTSMVLCAAVMHGLGMHQGAANDPELLEDALDRDLQFVYRCLFWLLMLFFKDKLFLGCILGSHNAAKADVAHASVDHLRLARRGTITQAVVGGAQVGPTLNDPARDAASASARA